MVVQLDRVALLDTSRPGAVAMLELTDAAFSRV
jgi:hypothetical protein